MPPNVVADATGTRTINAGSSSEFSYADLRRERTEGSKSLVAIHGLVYDITNFVKTHPGGAIINTAVGRDATVLFETHHTLVPSGIASVKKVLAKYQVGVLRDYKPVADFDTPFSRELIDRVRKVVQGKPRRDSWYATSSLLFFCTVFITLVGLAFWTHSIFVAVALGAIMSVGHVAGHAGNHWSLSSKDWVNSLVSVTCTNLWGLRERYWEFSHLISHHCYNYTDRDYIMEQHVPLKYFRVREADPWRPIHRYQHWLYITTFFTSFVLGALRLDCFPWIVLSPLLSSLRRNKDSVTPAPQFFASGSNVDSKALKEEEDGVGPQSFVVFDTWRDTIVSLVLSNIIWLPLFLSTWRAHGLLHAVLLNSVAFGTQAMIVTKNLLTQHMCEDIKLENNYKSTDDWYALQIEASTTVEKPKFAMWLSYAISYQTEHHMFPSLNPKLLIEVQPEVQCVAKEFGFQYNYLSSEREAIKSVFKQFKKLSVEPGKGMDEVKGKGKKE